MQNAFRFKFEAYKKQLVLKRDITRVVQQGKNKCYITGDDYIAKPCAGNMASICEDVASFGVWSTKQSWITVYPKPAYPENLSGANFYMTLDVGPPRHSRRTSNNIRPAQLNMTLSQNGKMYRFHTRLHVDVGGLNVSLTALPMIRLMGSLKKKPRPVANNYDPKFDDMVTF